MIPWKLLDSTNVPGDGGEMRLYQRGDEYSIRVGSYELMNSRQHASEDALAGLVCERLTGPVRLLIGGLGMGFTLARVLESTDRAAEVVVAELVPSVVVWNRGALGNINGHAVDDPRVTVREEDVAQVIRSAKDSWSAILLDVDNGPAGLTSKANDWLYARAGLRAIHEALRPSGMLAVWSGGPDPAFTRRLEEAGYAVEEHRVRGRGNKGGFRYRIWIATRKPQGS